jgi:hypothetical protein
MCVIGSHAYKIQNLRCMSDGEYPAIWKEAVIVPVPKVRGSTKPGDYRPISLLPLLSKIIEQSINSVLVSLIDEKLSNRQYGFRKGRSTVDALTTFQNNIFRGISKCEEAKRATNVVAVFFIWLKPLIPSRTTSCFNV